MSTDGILEYQGTKRVLFRGDTSNIVFDTRTTSLGIGVTGSNNPSSNLYITGNAYVSSNLAIGGVMTMGVVNVAARHNLQAVTDMGNVTTHTVEFTNPTTSLVASGNVEVAKELTVSGNTTVSSNLTVSGTLRYDKREYKPGEIIEEINTVCNGRPVTVQSGTYTPTNVTAAQTSSATYTEVNGSNITYNKPLGAKRIYYKFACHWEDAGDGALTNFKIQIYHNGAWRDINPSRYLHSAQYRNDGNNHGSMWVINEYIFECDADTESQHDGYFLSSKTSYTFRVVWRHHGNGYNSILHQNDWWDGAITNILHPPQLTIRAIA